MVIVENLVTKIILDHGDSGLYLGEVVEEAKYVVGGETTLRRVPEHDVSEAGSNVVEKIFNLRGKRAHLTFDSDLTLASTHLVGTKFLHPVNRGLTCRRCLASPKAMLRCRDADSLVQSNSDRRAANE